MKGAVEAVAWVVVALAGAGAAVGGWAWWQVATSRAFWILARAAQAAVVALAVVAGAGAAAGHRPDDRLFWVYVLVPVVVSLVAEQLRIASAETVLDARGLPSARAVGALPEAEQRSVALAVLRRELGVVAAALVVVAFLALRALGTDTGY